MAISYVNQTSLNSGIGTDANLAYLIPSGSAGNDLMFAVASVKPYTLDISSGTVLTDYTEISDHTNGSVANGDGVGSVRQFVSYRVHDGSESNPTGTLSAAPSPRMSTVSVWRNATGVWDVEAQDGPDTDESGTDVSCTAASTMDIASGDEVLVILSGGDNLSLASVALSIPGCTLGTLTLINSTNTTTTGNDGWIRFYRVSITAGSASGAPVFTATTTSGKSAAAATFIRMRELAAGTGYFGGKTATRLGASKAVQLASRM